MAQTDRQTSPTEQQTVPREPRDASVDVVIVGGGHNGLVAAAYLAQAGRSVLVLERADHTGGAAVSEFAFPGVEARLSRYSYLVSLLPQKIIDELRLDVRLARRRYSSYTPVPGEPGLGLLVDTGDPAATAASFARIGAEDDAPAFDELYDRIRTLAGAVWPTLTEPLLRRSEARALVEAAVTASGRSDGSALWDALIERPIGELIEGAVASDVVRGVVLTDALIGTFASAHAADLAQNRCFLYHLIGGGTGDWDVPVGGMGAVTAALERAAVEAGARILTGAEVTEVTPEGVVAYRRGPRIRRVSGATVLANVAPWTLERLLDAGGAAAPEAGAPRSRSAEQIPEGAQVKVNLVLERLPRLLDETVSPEAAFGGTFHINERYSQLETAYSDATKGLMPSPIPCEIYCHTLTDPSILSPELAASGAHTLTVFGLHTPDRWLSPHNNEGTRERMTRAVLASLNSVLAEPIEDLVLTDANGEPCIETKTTQDLERALGMPGGNIFHGPLSWPFVDDEAPLDTPAERWGVATRHPRILLCGSGARRGGAVSGLGGHNAAMAVLEGE